MIGLMAAPAPAETESAHPHKSPTKLRPLNAARRREDSRIAPGLEKIRPRAA